MNFELNQQGGVLNKNEENLFKYINEKNDTDAVKLLTNIQDELFDPTGPDKIIDFNKNPIQKVEEDTYLHAAIKSLAVTFDAPPENAQKTSAGAFGRGLIICSLLINIIFHQRRLDISNYGNRFEIFSTKNGEGQIPLVYALQKLPKTSNYFIYIPKTAPEPNLDYTYFYKKIIKILFENTINSDKDGKSLIENVKGNDANFMHHNEKREGNGFGKVILNTENNTLEDKVKKELNLLIKYYNFSIDKEVGSWISDWYQRKFHYFLHAAIDSIADPNKKDNQYTNGQILIKLIEGTEEASFVDSGHESKEIPLIYAVDKLPLPSPLEDSKRLITNYKEIISSLFEKTKQQDSNDILLKRYLETAESGKNRLGLLVKSYNPNQKGWIDVWYKKIIGSQIAGLNIYDQKLFKYIKQKNVEKAVELLEGIQEELKDPKAIGANINFNKSIIQKNNNGDTYLHAAIKSLADAAVAADAKLLIFTKSERREESARLAALAAIAAFENSLKICEQLIDTILTQRYTQTKSYLLRFKIFSTENEEGQIPLVYALQKLQKKKFSDKNEHVFYKEIIKILFENTINSVHKSEGKKSLIENVKGDDENFMHHNEELKGKEFGKVKLNTVNYKLEDKVKKELNLLIKYYNFSIDKEVGSWISDWYQRKFHYFLHAAIDSIADPNKKDNQYTNGQILIKLIEGTEEASFVDYSGHESNEISLIYALDKLPLPDKDKLGLVMNYKEIISSLFEKTKLQIEKTNKQDSYEEILEGYLPTAESGKNKRSEETSYRLSSLVKRYNSKKVGWIDDWYNDITSSYRKLKAAAAAAAAAAAKSSVGKTLASLGSFRRRPRSSSPTSEGGGDCKYVAGTFGHWHSI